MPRTVVVRGHVVDARTVELESPVPGAAPEVEVVLRLPDDVGSPESLADFLRQLPPGTRSKEDIDKQIQEERDSWER